MKRIPILSCFYCITKYLQVKVYNNKKILQRQDKIDMLVAGIEQATSSLPWMRSAY